MKSWDVVSSNKSLGSSTKLDEADSDEDEDSFEYDEGDLDYIDDDDSDDRGIEASSPNESKGLRKKRKVRVVKRNKSCRDKFFGFIKFV